MKSEVPTDAGGSVYLQIFTPNRCETISAAGDVDISGFAAVMFDAEIGVYLNDDSTNVFVLAPYIPFGIDPGVATIHVSGACNMWAM